MKRPPKPKATTHQTTRCDGSVVKWRDEWKWVTHSCQECGHPDGDGDWENHQYGPGFHVGEYKPDHAPDWSRIESLYFTPTSLMFGPGPGVWECCGVRSDGLPPGGRAILTNITDASLTV